MSMPFSHRRMMLPAKRRMPTNCRSPVLSALCTACRHDACLRNGGLMITHVAFGDRGESAS